jgi:hypothetical protein
MDQSGCAAVDRRRNGLEGERQHDGVGGCNLYTFRQGPAGRQRARGRRFQKKSPRARNRGLTRVCGRSAPETGCEIEHESA